MAILTDKERLDRLEAAREIENLMGRYVFFRMYDMLDETVELFTKTEDTLLAMPMGVYEGPDAAERAIKIDHAPMSEEAKKGTLIMHNVCTPVIEIAGDGATGKGVWISPGMATVGPPGDKHAMRCWLKYSCDFKKISGEWKIWHMYKYNIFNLPYEKSWTEDTDVPDGEIPRGYSDRPREGKYGYNTDTEPDRVPLPPKSYYTWGED